MTGSKFVSGFEQSAIQCSVPGRLRSLFRERPEPLLLLGAGASVSSGIPAAEEAAERIVKWRWCLDHDRLQKDSGVRRADYAVADAEAMIATNLLGPIRLIAALLPHLRARPAATIMTVSSGLAFVPLAATPTYSAT